MEAVQWAVENNVAIAILVKGRIKDQKVGLTVKVRNLLLKSEKDVAKTDIVKTIAHELHLIKHERKRGETEQLEDNRDKKPAPPKRETIFITQSQKLRLKNKDKLALIEKATICIKESQHEFDSTPLLIVELSTSHLQIFKEINIHQDEPNQFGQMSSSQKQYFCVDF